MPFVEFFNLASYCVDDPNRETSLPGASILAGIGYVSGVRSMICVDDSGINAAVIYTNHATHTTNISYTRQNRGTGQTCFAVRVINTITR